MQNRTEQVTRRLMFLCNLTVAPIVVAAVVCTLSGTILADNALSADENDERADTQPAYVHMETSKGAIYLELNRKKAPISVENFLQYVEDEFYDGTIFHRVIPTFMIQGGGFTPEMQQKPTRDPIQNEWENGLTNDRGTIAMARTQLPDSATAQFFINVRDNSNLDQPISGGAGYAVFGKVIAGMDVVDAIRKVPTTRRGPHADVPEEPVIIEKVRTISAEEARNAVEAEHEDDDAETD